MENQPTPPPPEIPFVNEVRLNWKNWWAVVVILAAFFWATPRVWKKLERFDIPRDYRIPYSLSKDYWLYQRRIENEAKAQSIFVLGDSVVWGEYVLPDGTLSHFLNQGSGQTDRFINAGVNGLYPLAIEGLANHYAPLRHRKVILHCNLLWMSSPKADLHDNKAQQLNHSRLLPQFEKIPSYKADANERLSVLCERNSQFLSWVGHLQMAYFDDKSVPAWTLVEGDGNFPNAYKNPLRQISMRVPEAAANDPDRGPASARHRAWTQTIAAPTRFDWVSINESLQWGAFKRTLEKLIASGNDVLVIIGPFNEHLISPDSRAGFAQLRDGVVAHLEQSKIPFVKPAALPSALYADGSHPLTEGYQLLADRLLGDPVFQKWLLRSGQ